MNRKKNIVLLYAIALLQGMCFYGPIATLYRQAQGVSVFQITLIEGIHLILCLLLEIPWGIVADRIGYRNTMIFCSGLYFVSKLLFWQAKGFWWFLAERVLLSVVTAGISGVDTSILYLSCEKGRSQRVFGIYNGLSMLGLVTAAVVFSVFIGENYKLAAGLTVVSYGLAAILSCFLAEVKSPGNTKKRSQLVEFKRLLRGTLKNPPLILFLIAVAFLSETHQTITVFLNQIRYERCGLSAAAIGSIYIAVTLVGLSGVCSARLTGKVGKKGTGLLLYGAAAAACVGLALAESAAASVLGILTLRIVNSLFQPFQTELQNKQVQTENRAMEVSIYAMIVDSVGAGVNLVFGFLAEISLPGAFLFGGGLCLAGACLFARWYGQGE